MLKSLGGLGVGLAAPGAHAHDLVAPGEGYVNDVHSRLNPTRVREDRLVRGVDEVVEAIARARRSAIPVSVAGGRHAMGGQQFASDGVVLDTRGMDRVTGLDAERGLVEAQAGIQWPALIEHLLRAQAGRARQWGIVQKQTGADRLCLGGALAANVHGRGLALKPIIGDVESLRLVDANGDVRTCSRTENRELFALAIGGYGLFGVIASVTLRLAPRRRLRRVVELADTHDLAGRFDERIAAGFLYGDCQFSIDPGSPGFLRQGVFSCYEPVDDASPVPEGQKSLGEEDWRKLYVLAHRDPARVFDLYASYYLSTSGQVYWSDTHQLSTYIDDYHPAVDRAIGADWPGSEMITEVYVRRADLASLLDVLAEDFRRHRVQLIYGTIRLIERDDESFLPWAREPYACVVMNLHVAHSPQEIAKAGADFRRIIDRAMALGGSYFLTYHRWASREQVETCYPRMREFLALKRRHDPDEVFQSDWYRHHRDMLA